MATQGDRVIKKELKRNHGIEVYLRCHFSKYWLFLYVFVLQNNLFCHLFEWTEKNCQTPEVRRLFISGCYGPGRCQAMASLVTFVEHTFESIKAHFEARLSRRNTFSSGFPCIPAC